MNKTQLIAQVAQRTGVTKRDAERLVNTTLEVMAETLQSHEKVQLSGFGTFEAKLRSGRTGRNMQTQAPVDVKPAWAPTFKPSKLLRDQLAQQEE